LASGLDPDRLTWDDVDDLDSYWRGAPPVNESVAAFLGYGDRGAGEAPPAAPLRTEADARRLVDALNAAGMGRAR
jgi:hypothetical protein